jgi:integrase
VHGYALGYAGLAAKLAAKFRADRTMGMGTRGAGRLTQDAINRALTKSAPFTLRDGNGLLLVRGKRKIGWLHEYRLPGIDAAGRRHSKKLVHLAPYSPGCRLAEARQLNAVARVRVGEGHDVLAEQRTARAVNVARADTEGMTVSALIRSFVAAREDNWRPATVAAFKSDLAIIDNALGTLPVKDVTRARLMLFLQDYIAGQQAQGARGTRAARLRMHMGSLFIHALDLELIEHTPTARLKLPVSARVRARERVLSLEEIVSTWQALERLAVPMAVAFQIAFVTGARIGAVILADESELDLNGTVSADTDGKPTWKIPGSPGRKARTPQIVPLSGLAVRLWRRALTWPGRNAGVAFPGGVPGRSLLRTSVSTQWLEWVRAGALPAGTTPHDLRRTARSWWSGLDHGQSRDAMERLLGHAVGGKVERTYDRSLHLPAQRRVADAWGRWLIDTIDAKKLGQNVRKLVKKL